jgi:hypothetical protein
VLGTRELLKKVTKVSAIFVLTILRVKGVGSKLLIV